MTKYDDFGRPIYETAEEYNRAHRSETNTRTYDNMGDAYNSKSRKRTYRTQRMTGQYTKRNTSKKTKVLLIGIAVYVSVIIVVLLFNLVGSFEDGIYEDNFTAIEEAVVDVDDEYIGDNTAGAYSHLLRLCGNTGTEPRLRKSGRLQYVPRCDRQHGAYHKGRCPVGNRAG